MPTHVHIYRYISMYMGMYVYMFPQIHHSQWGAENEANYEAFLFVP